MAVISPNDITTEGNTVTYHFESAFLVTGDVTAVIPFGVEGRAWAVCQVTDQSGATWVLDWMGTAASATSQDVIPAITGLAAAPADAGTLGYCGLPANYITVRKTSGTDGVKFTVTVR